MRKSSLYLNALCGRPRPGRQGGQVHAVAPRNGTDQPV